MSYCTGPKYFFETKTNEPIILFDSVHRLAVVLAVLFSLFLVHSEAALAAPVDPITGSTPSFDAAPEEGTNYNAGDWGVSDQNGAATYTYSINVPPGRNGMAPSLALRYSSNLPLRGGLAVGWSFHIPSIQEDLSLGVTEDTQYKIDLGSASGRLVEVSDTSPYPNGKAYRIQFDDSNTRIFSSNPTSSQSAIKGWVALTPDGVHHYFQEPRDTSNNKGIWHITSQVDSFGNTVRYIWSAFSNANPNGPTHLGQSLSRIEYSSNDTAALIPHAKIEFEYAPLTFCFSADTSTTPTTAIISDLPIGAAYRKGSQQVTGAKQLAAIKISVRDSQTSNWRLSGQTDLTYQYRNSKLYKQRDPEVFVDSDLAKVVEPRVFDSSHGQPPKFIRCKQNPLRYLTKIDVEAFGPDGTGTTIPPVNFQYNHRFDTSRRIVGGINPEEHLPLIEVISPGFAQEGTSGGKLGGLKTTLLDIDNDGIRDRVYVKEANKVCTLVWHKGLLGGLFESQAHKSALPTAAWYQEWRGFSNPVIDVKEGCTLSGQIAYRSTIIGGETTTGTIFNDNVMARGVVSYHFMDYTGDGRLDLITNVWESSGCHWTYDPWTLNAVDTGKCTFNQGLESVSLSGSSPSTKPEKGRLNIERFIWRVYPGTGNPAQPFLNNTLLPTSITVESPLPLPPSSSEEKIDVTETVNYSVPILFDLDGDGFLDIIASQLDAQKIQCNNKILLKSCNWTVYFGNGSREFPKKSEAHTWGVPTPVTLASDQWVFGTADGTEPFVQGRTTVIDLKDMNGDGLSDLVVRQNDKKLYSYRNTGTGFDNQAHPINGSSALEEVKTDIDQFLAGGTLTDGDRGYLRRLVDLDGDGLLDMVRFAGPRNDITLTRVVKAKFNLGNRFGNEVTLLFPEKWASSKRLLSAKWQSGFEGTWHIATDFTDVSGDGLADLVQWHGSTMSYISSPGLDKASDLLSKVTNGRGMELTFSYAPSTDRKVVSWTDENSALPRVTWVVKKMTVKGGHGTPTTTTQYRYQNPNYKSAGDQTGFKERSQFAGFSKNIQTTNFANGKSKQIQKQYHYTGLHGDLINIQTFRDGQLHRVKRKGWKYKTLFNGRIHVALPSLSTSCITKAPNMSEDDCFAQNDHVHRIEQTWLHNSISHQFENNHSVEGAGNTDQAKDHRTIYQYDLRYGTVTGHDPEDYRVRVRETNEAIRVR